MKAIEIRNLSVILDGREVLSRINLDINEGTFLGVVGPNGSGKTTLLRVIIGLIKPSEGSVLIFGKGPDKLIRQGIFGYLPQHQNVETGFPITSIEVVMMGLPRKGLFRRHSEAEKRIAMEMLSIMGMEGYENHIYGSLSGGQQQRVSIARALVSRPRILVLDEPSTGIDVVGQEDFYHLLRGIQKKFNLTIIMVSHDIGTITTYVDEIACLNRTLHYHGNPLGAFDRDVLKGLYGKSMEIIMHTGLCEKCERLKPEIK
jgi:zinc transport system ATP-binding protein